MVIPRTITQIKDALNALASEQAEITARLSELDAVKCNGSKLAGSIEASLTLAEDTLAQLKHAERVAIQELKK